MSAESRLGGGGHAETRLADCRQRARAMNDLVADRDQARCAAPASIGSDTSKLLESPAIDSRDVGGRPTCDRGRNMADLCLGRTSPGRPRPRVQWSSVSGAAGQQIGAGSL